MAGTLDALRELRRLAKANAKKLRRRGEELIAEIERRKPRIAREFHEIGRALQELAQPRIYLSMGYKSLGELLDGRRLMGRSSAYRLMAVAQAFTKAQALRLGAEKAYALTRYVAATPADDLASALVDADATIDGKKVSAISLRELEAAARAVRKPARSPKSDPEERAAHTAARTAQAGVRRMGVRSARAKAVRDGDEWVVCIEVPVEAVERLVRGR